MNNDIFFTLNPHINNLSKTRLINDFNNSIKKFYRQKLGPRYYNHKDKQYPLGVAIEDGTRVIKEPHLHMLIKNNDNLALDFCIFTINILKDKYTSLTFAIKSIGNTDLDDIKVWNYTLKEDNSFITNQDLYSMNYIK